MRRIDANHAFSHSLVSNYERWLNAESDYNRYYGSSENPPDFADYDLGNRLNFYAQLFKLSLLPEHEKDDTSLVLGKEFENLLNATKSDCRAITFTNNKGEDYVVSLSDDFDVLCRNRIRNTPKQQVEIKGTLPNGLHFVGYADEVYDNCIIDIKTTSNFNKSNYDNSMQIALYLHFIPDYLVQRGFYQVTEFYRSKAAGKREFTMKDTFMIESSRITESQLIRFSDLCAEILKNVSAFERDLENYRKYYQPF
jgi:hypothetical protein